MKKTIGLFVLLAAAATAQTWTGSVGTPAAIPNPTAGGVAGSINLQGCNCPNNPTNSTIFEITGIPSGYAGNSPAANELCAFILDVGTSTVPGVNLGGALFYLPLISPVTIMAPTPPTSGLIPGSCWFIGPVGICSGSCVGNSSSNRLGAVLNLSSWYMPGFGNFTMQGVLLDTTTGALFTSNAVNFS